jgi:acyl-ACP thioesterase
VRSTDIDLGGHMNNAAYVRALAALFSCGQWQDMEMRELEIAYRAPCFEGDTLCWQKREDGSVLTLRAALPEGKTIALARIVRG